MSVQGYSRKRGGYRANARNNLKDTIAHGAGESQEMVDVDDMVGADFLN